MIDPREWEGRIYIGDCLEFLRELPDGCVDAVVTDPPYPKEWEHLYAPVATESFRVTREGGHCLTMCGHYQLPLVMRAFESGGWDWHWLCSLRNISYPRMFGFSMMVTQKPILWWTKGTAKHRMVRDSVTGRDWGEAQEHKWGQPLEWGEYCVESATDPGDLVLDPFLGSGTTAVVCERLGRRWIGCEINPEYAAMAQKRIERERDKLQLPIGAMR